VNEKLLEIILTRFTELRDHDEPTSREEDVGIQNNDHAIEHAYILF
jgi:hypothetical protein